MSAEPAPVKTVPLRLAPADDPRQGPPHDAVGVWLDMLDRLLRLPAKEAEAIREELESHLRERVRDLEVSGMNEGEAVRCAVSELGDTAALAQRYRDAHAFPRRRLMMNLSMLAMAGAALVLGVTTLSQPGERIPVSVFSSPAISAADHASLLKKIDANFENVPLSEVFDEASRDIGMPIIVAWAPIEIIGISRDAQVNVGRHSSDFANLLAALNDQVFTAPDARLDFRVEDGGLRVATENYFDRREILLVSYDLTAINQEVPTEAVTELIHNFVHAPGWVDNGGDLARLALVGAKMFVSAPKRYHAEIKWFLEELDTDSRQAATTTATK